MQLLLNLAFNLNLAFQHFALNQIKSFYFGKKVHLCDTTDNERKREIFQT